MESCRAKIADLLTGWMPFLLTFVGAPVCGAAIYMFVRYSPEVLTVEGTAAVLLCGAIASLTFGIRVLRTRRDHNRAEQYRPE